MGHYLELNTKPVSQARGTEGRKESHIYFLWWWGYKWSSLPPCPPFYIFFTSSSYYSWFFLRRHIPTLWPEWIWVLSVVTSSTFTAEIPSSFYGSAEGEVGRVRGSPSRGTPTPNLPPLSQLSTVLHITDKLWQMGSGECFLHTHVIWAITLVLPSSPRYAPPPCLLGGLLSMWRSHWRKCQLNLRSLHTAVRPLSTVTGDLQQQRGGPACLVTVRQRALWCCGWCAARSALCTLSGPGSDYRPLWRGNRAWKQQDQAEHASMGNVLMNRQTFLLWAGNTNLQMLNSWETSETTAWEISTHKTWYTVHTAELSIQ